MNREIQGSKLKIRLLSTEKENSINEHLLSNLESWNIEKQIGMMIDAENEILRNRQIY